MTDYHQVFRFKKFNLYQDKAAMKVGTDGVLLGAWVNVKNKNNLLDVGSGSGLIALMMAQRNQQAIIDAVEIDPNAVEQTRYNFDISPWKNRLQVYHSDFRRYQSVRKYDLIVSNPPYFDENYYSGNRQRDRARHTKDLKLSDLVEKSIELLSTGGHIALILPYQKLQELQDISKHNGLFFNKITYVKGNPAAKVKRFLCDLSFEKNILETETLIIEIKRHQYTPEYVALTRDFYLKM
jgi:tRNA1Val (adenine37-N6)-methyltransferase